MVEILTPSSIVGAAPDVLSSVVGDETVILHFSAGTYFGLDEVGTRIWQLIAEPRPVAEIRDRLLEEYEVEPDHCERSTLALLLEMTEHGLVTVHAPAAS